MKRQIVDLNRIVSDLTKLLGRLIGEDIKLVASLQDGIWSVLADAGQLEQVIVNLAVNARDAMPAGGTLTLATRNVVIDGADSVSLRATDTGVGIEESIRERIFEPFFTTKEVGKGTGLGLATVYGIVKQSGGNVAVASEVGKGTTFEICLPRATAEALETAAAHTFTGEPTAGTILVVDDEDAIRAVAVRILVRGGYQVLSARNGPDALMLLERHAGPLDLVVTDVVMPGISGPAMVQKLLTERPKVKVLYTSGYTDDTVLRHGVSTDQLHFLNKPYSPDILVQKVAEVLHAP